MTGDGGRFKRHGASTDPRSGHSRAEADSSGFGSRMLQQISFVLAVVIGVSGLIAVVTPMTGNVSPYGMAGAMALGALLLYLAFRYVQRRCRRRSTETCSRRICEQLHVYEPTGAVVVSPGSAFRKTQPGAGWGSRLHRSRLPGPAQVSADGWGWRSS